jgi:hypothetical protein
MIVSHTYRYLFIELPHTGTTAISKELCQYYDGSPILFKHATYRDFLRVATPEEKKYFVFSGIRNPLDNVVSYYFKYKNKKFSFLIRDDKFRRLIYSYQRQKAKSVVDEQADFPTFFLRYYHLPYDDWSALDHHRFDYVLRFESLAQGFSEVLQRLQIPEVRPLPVIHKTVERDKEFWSYYTPETWARAQRVFGPYMARWGYTFPTEWGAWSHSAVDQAAFGLCRAVRKAYWLYLRPPVYNLLRKERSARSRNASLAQTR